MNPSECGSLRIHPDRCGKAGCGVSGFRGMVRRDTLKGTEQPHLNASVSRASMYGNEGLSLSVGNLE